MPRFARPAAYTRISKDRTGEELGVQRQREDIQLLAEQREVTITQYYEDNDLSASRGGPRPQFAELMEAVEAGEIDVILVWNLSRLLRSRVERAHAMEIFRKHGVSILCVKGPDIDLTTATGRLLAGLMGEVDAHEVEQMSEREQRAMQQRVERGLPPTGPRCYGYTATGGKIVPHEAENVRRMFDALLAGDTLSGIAADMNRRGVLNRNGRPWRHNSVRVLLLNSRYAALREYRGRIYPGKWEPIIPEATWQAARHILADESRKTSPGPARRHLLSGLARCGVCDDGTTVTGASRGVSYGENRHGYRCRTGKHLVRTAKHIDDFVRDTALARLARPDAADLLVDHDAPDTEELRRKAVALRGRLRALAAEFADDDEADLAEFREAGRRIRERLAAVEAQMVNGKRARALAPLIGAESLRETWDGLGLSRRRAVVETLMEVTIRRARPGRSPFDPSTIRIEWR